MADDEDKGDGGTVKVTDNFLKNFYETAIKKFLEDVKKAEPVLSLRAYSDGTTPFLTGNNSGNFTAPGTLATTLKTYDASVAAMLGTVVDQFGTLTVDIQLADRLLNNSLDESLDYAQFMKLAGRTLNPGK
ncbi:hypothetical protein [Kitasatospora purpeofusca]|uniref:hypothetical protein n=1 Tax=Kitasatospora purpeofusca TaxID=67352 RepID=UPI002A5A2077|nr:hypothetical protein [Kitasatospora purpeofusca]MDY0813830.1 hypothetical protein [Kitasatospora purpeofusca]